MIKVNNDIVSKWLVPLFFVSAAIICIWVAFTQKGTGDTGDSIMHYLFAKHSFQHPELFLHHWAKPVFVLMAAPAAQLGLVGMKLFNLAIVLLTLYLTYNVTIHLQKDRSWAVLIFTAFVPLYMLLTFSGLTEPMFALFLVAGIRLLQKEKWLWAVVLFSFMPFVRSEGLIIIGVAGFYLLLQKRFRYIPLLAFGHIVYSLIGFVHYHDFLWVFKEIPYASLQAYGSGPWYHFIESLYYVLGPTLYLLMWLGLVSKIYYLISQKGYWQANEMELVMIYGTVLAYVTAHSLFWYLGIFNSMGLNRVLIGIVPLIGVIALDGFNFLLDFRQNKYYKNILGSLLLSYILVFPFFPHPAALDLPDDFRLSPDQQLALELAVYLKEEHPGKKPYYLHPYLHIALGLDPFDESQYGKLLNRSEMPINKQGIYIWDDWFVATDQGMPVTFLKEVRGMSEVKRFEKEVEGRKYQFVLFLKD